MPPELSDHDFRVLADFRCLLRQFLAFSAERAEEFGLSPQQHQALLVIRAEPAEATVGTVARRLMLKPQSATGLVDRLGARGLVVRRTASKDRRRTVLELTDQAKALLTQLTAAHREEIRRLRSLLKELLDQLD